MALQDLIKSRVIDEQANQQYLKMLENPIFGAARFITTSNPDLEIDPHMNMGAVTKKIKRLPRAERAIIKKKIEVWRISWNKLQALKIRALGKGNGQSHAQISDILESRKEELIEYFGNLKQIKEIKRIIKLDWGYPVNDRQLSKFRAKYHDQINQSIVDFNKDFSHLRLSHKRGRLEELQEIYRKRKLTWYESPSVANEKQLQSIINQIAKEVEDKTIKLQADINHVITQNINVKIQEEVMGNMPINDIIIARAARAMGVNPRFILARLHNSVYATLTGAKKPSGALESEEIIYPSQMVYDWNAIEKDHNEHGDVGLDLAEYEDVTEEKTEQAKTLKEKLQQKIADRKAKLDEVSIKLSDEESKK